MFSNEVEPWKVIVSVKPVYEPSSMAMVTRSPSAPTTDAWKSWSSEPYGASSHMEVVICAVAADANRTVARIGAIAMM